LKVREKLAQIAPECISEHLISKFFRGSMPPDPLSGNHAPVCSAWSQTVHHSTPTLKFVPTPMPGTSLKSFLTKVREKEKIKFPGSQTS